MDNNLSYKPISCNFYDYLEEAATLSTVSTIEYMDKNLVIEVQSKIKTLLLKDKVEYMVLENNQSIRLDNLLSFNGKLLAESC